MSCGITAELIEIDEKQASSRVSRLTPYKEQNAQLGQSPADGELRTGSCVDKGEPAPMVIESVQPETQPFPQCAGVFPHQPYCEQQVPIYTVLSGSHSRPPLFRPHRPFWEYARARSRLVERDFGPLLKY